MEIIWDMCLNGIGTEYERRNKGRSESFLTTNTCTKDNKA